MKNNNEKKNGHSYPKRLLKIPEGADYLNISSWTLRGWISDGKIPTVRQGQRWIRVDVNDLDKWIESHKERF